MIVTRGFEVSGLDSLSMPNFRGGPVRSAEPAVAPTKDPEVVPERPPVEPEREPNTIPRREPVEEPHVDPYERPDTTCPVRE